MIPPAEPFRQILPNLTDYRQEFASAGVTLPLPTVPWRAEGLLATLPPSPAGRHGWPWDVQTAPFAENPDGWPRIAIVLPSFKQADYLEEALRSVLLQNYPKLELIAMDGGSPDASPMLLERYRPWLSFSRSAPDRGQGHAINLGFSLASADLHGWLNSDDFYLPGALRRVATMWRRTPAEFIYGDALSLDQATGRYQPAPAGLAHGRYVRFPGLIFSHATFWAAQRHQPVWEEIHCALDYELWLRLVPGLRQRHIPQALGVVREHPEAKSHNPKIRQRWEEDARRNGLAHPELYQAGLANRLRVFEFRAVQRLYLAWHRRRRAESLTTLCRDCGWDDVIAPGD
jgi:glycosyltransferase involved in cell wall biosynthesis